MFSDGTFNITYAGGYFDGSNDDGVYGNYWNNKLIETLVRPCPASFKLMPFENYDLHNQKERRQLAQERANGCGRNQSYNQSCGFSRSDDPEILTKKILIDGKPKLIRMRILTSSLFDSDTKNRQTARTLVSRTVCADKSLADKMKCLTMNTPPAISYEELQKFCRRGDEHLYQPCRSGYVRDAWRRSIANGDEMVIYDGHARNGGGPSFYPPRKLANGHVDYAWYRMNRPGHKDEIAAFEQAEKKGKSPSVYMSLSCNSERHFLREGKFPEVSKNTSYVLSKRITWGDEGLAAFLSTLESVATRRCDQLDKSVSGASCAFGVFNL
jgi:hypothetical protein